MGADHSRSSIWRKLLLSTLTVITLCAITHLSQFLFCTVKYGLPDGTYPLQSLSYFAACEKNISLYDAYLVFCILKTVGYLYFAALTLVFSTLFKKYAATAFLATAAVILPYFAFTFEQYAYLPIPLSFIMSANWFLGPRVDTNYVTGEAEVLYSEITWCQLALITAAGAAISAVCVLVILWRSANRWDRSRIKKRCTKVSAFLLCIVLSIPFCGCTPTGESSEISYYNCNAPGVFVSNDYAVAADAVAGVITVTNQKNGETYDLCRDAVSELSSVTSTGVLSVFGRGNRVYYLMQYRGMLQVRETALDTMEEKIVFEKPLRDALDFFGLNIAWKSKWSSFANVMGVFVDEQYFYFTFSSDTFNGVRKVNRYTLSVESLEIPIVNAFYDGLYYYYLDDIGALTKYDLHNKKTELVDGVVSKSCYLYRKRLYYVNRMDHNYVYSCDVDGSDQHLEASTSCMYITFLNGMLTAIPVSGGSIELLKAQIES